jgi:acetate kinase
MQGKVQVINCGSSSVKFAVKIADNGHIFAKGIAECLFLENPVLKSPKH